LRDRRLTPQASVAKMLDDASFYSRMGRQA
jgi:hypothetical protein